MPLSDGYKAIDTAWASGVGADRTDPDDASLTPPLVVVNGWPASFSADAGDTPRRAVFNEMYWRRDSALLDIRNHGVLPWDTAVDTLEGGVKQVNGALYRALADNGPTYANAVSPTAPGQTVWEGISGQSNTPGAPNPPTATTPESETLDWSWNCPLDGGAVITAFDFQWRQQGAAQWSMSIVVTTPRYLLTGLTNGQVYEAQVRARNSLGDGPWSTAGTGTPQGTTPGGGATFALRADAGDGEADLDWLEPDDGGETITGYTVQWREAGQAFAAGRQVTVSGTEYTRSGLTNNTEYFFRVRAANSQGDGPWSNEASATPMADTTPTPTPDTEPSAPTNLVGTPRRPLAIDWTWELPDSNGGQRIQSYDFQWRYDGDAWAGNLTTGLEASYFRHSIADTTRAVQARVRAVNSVGASAWITPTVTVSQADIVAAGAVSRRVRLTSTQSYTWPFDGVGNAVFNFVDDSNPAASSVLVSLPNSRFTIHAQFIQYEAQLNSRISLGVGLSVGGATEIFLDRILFRRDTGRVIIETAPSQTEIASLAGPDFSTQMESSGAMVFTASNGDTLTLIGIGDTSEPYTWIPSNSAEVIAFADTVAGLSDRSLAVLFNEDGSTQQIPSNGVTVGGVQYTTEGIIEVQGISDNEIIGIRLEGTGGDGRVDIFPQPQTS